jgi:hypothetical protein
MVRFFALINSAKFSHLNPSITAGNQWSVAPLFNRRGCNWLLVQTGPGAHPTSCTVGTESLPELKRPGRGFDHSPTYSAEVKDRAELYLYSTSGPSWPVMGWPLPLLYFVGRDSWVDTATRYGMEGPGIEYRWGGEIFRTHPDRPWGPPSLLYNGYRVFFSRGEAAGAWRWITPIYGRWKIRAPPLDLLGLF